MFSMLICFYDPISGLKAPKEENYGKRKPNTSESNDNLLVYPFRLT